MEPASHCTRSGAPPVPADPPPEPLGGGSGATGSGARASRNWSIAAHLTPAVAFVTTLYVPFNHVAAVAIPYVIWRSRGARDEEVAEQARASVNFQLHVLAAVALARLFLFRLAWPVVLAIEVANLACMVMAAARASGGERFRYPIARRFV